MTTTNTNTSYLNPERCNSHHRRKGLKRPRQQHKQHQHVSSSSCFLWSSVWAAAILRSAIIISTNTAVVEAQFVAPTLSECKTFLAISDENRDEKLTQAEYVVYINYMSDSYYGDDVFFAQLPQELTTNFVYWAGNDGLMDVYGAIPGSQPTADQEETLEEICFDTTSILHAITTLAPTQLGTSSAPSVVPDDSPTTLAPIDIPFANCRTNMAISDFNADSRLNPEAEYLRFIAHMSIQQLVYDDYQDLPELLRFNFVLLSEMDPLDPETPRYMNITGSRPGEDLEEIGVTQVQFLEKICHQTQNAINTLNLFGVPSAVRPVGPPPTSPSPTTATLAPVLPPLFLPKQTTRPGPGVSKPPLPFSPTPTSPTPTARPTNSFSQCRLAITSSDRNRNNLIDEEEYTELVYRLSGNNPLYRWETYDTLPVNLRDTYNVLAAQGDVVGEINVYGAAPRQNPTLEEREFLELVCTYTEDEIANVPTPAPIMQPTPTPTEDFSECRRDMAFSDTSPRDSFLDRPEYVKFVNLLAVGQASFFRYTFYTLPKVLRDNFDDLASVEHSNPDANGNGEAIYIYGSFLLQDADPVQVEFLRRICRDTEAALEAATMPSSTTAPKPTLMPIMIATPAPFTLPPIAQPTPAPNPQPTTPGTPTPQPTLRPLTPRPTNVPTPQPTPLLGFPTLNPTTGYPTATPIDEGGVNTGALVGGCVAALFVLIACIALGRYALERGKQIQQQQQQQMGDDSKKDDQDEETGNGGGVDMFDNIGVAPSPAPSSNEEEESDEEEGSDEEEDEEESEEDEEMGEASGKEFGEFGGPNLPMDFGEELEIASTSGSDSSGSEEERPSTFDDDDEEEDEEDLDNDAFFGDNKQDGFDAFGGGGGDEWGGDDLDEEESGSGSRSGSGSYSDQEDDEEYSGSEEGSGDEEEEDEEGGSQYDDEEESSREESSREDDEDDYSEGEEDEEESSREEDEGEKGGGTDGFGDTFGADGFGDFGATDDFGTGQNDFFGGDGGGGDKSDGFGGDFFGAAEDEGDDGDDSYKSSSHEEEIEKVSNKLDAQIDDGDWEGVAKSIASFASDPEMSESGGDVSHESDSEDESDEDDEDDDDNSASPAVIAKRAAYRAKVEDLVNRVIPDEKDNIDGMMEQFEGREEELIGTLTAMEEKSSQQPIPTPPGSDSVSGSHSGSYSGSYSGTSPQTGSSPSTDQSPGAGGFRGGLEGVPEMEDASFIPSIAEGDEGEEESSSQSRERSQEDEGGQGWNDFDESQSQYSEAMTELSPEDKGEEEGSYVSGEEGSYVSGEEGSQYSGEEGSGSYVSGEEGSQYSGEEGSYVSGEEGSQYSGEEGSYVSGEEGSQYSGEEGSQYSGEEGSGSYVSGEEGSQYSGEEGSYVSGEEGSQYSGEEGSYVSGEEGSQYSGEEGSYVSGEEGSQYSGEEGSYVSGEEGSQYSGEEGEDGSYVSGEEGSYYSGEEGSQYSGEEGSYVSGEEGSYYSGEEGSQYSGEEGSYYSGSGSYDD